MTTPHYFVTGGTGCIGSWVVRNLLHDGCEVTILDYDRDLHRLELILTAEELQRVHLAQGDVTDLDSLSKAFAGAGITHVIHLAALQIPFCRANPSLGAQVNVVGTVNTFEVARHSGLDRVVFASSAGVYGPKEAYPPGPVAHDAPLIPRSHYGVYKQANEVQARVYWKDEGISSIGLRPHVVYGPGRDQGMTSTPTKAMLAAVLGQPYTISFGGRYCAQFVDDVAKTFICAAQAEFEGANVFNIGGRVPATQDFIDAIESVLPEARGTIEAQSNVLPFPEAFDNRALEKVIGTIPQTPLREGVRQTIAVFQQAVAEGKIDAEQLEVA